MPLRIRAQIIKHQKRIRSKIEQSVSKPDTYSEVFPRFSTETTPSHNLSIPRIPHKKLRDAANMDRKRKGLFRNSKNSKKSDKFDNFDTFETGMGTNFGTNIGPNTGGHLETPYESHFKPIPVQQSAKSNQAFSASKSFVKNYIRKAKKRSSPSFEFWKKYSFSNGKQTRNKNFEFNTVS